MIVGTKGSPLQLILSSIYHADVPAGNIDVTDYEELKKNPHIRQTIPLALGDNYRGWRVVGTNNDYLTLYKAELAEGQSLTQDFDVVAGAQTDVPLGAEFAALHGYSADSDDVHNFHLYKVVGRLKPTGTVLDKLLVTTLGSVQALHAHPDADDPDAAEELALGHQLTAVLVKTRSATDVMNLPHQINENTNMMAAVPSYEIARLAKNLGFGRNLLVALGVGFVSLSALMMLGFLAASLASRRYDLAVLRVLGASRGKVWLTVMFEGLLLSGIGCIAGLLLGRLLLWELATRTGLMNGFIMPQQFLAPAKL
jgi:putative ABC transport system permease protein